MIPCSRPMPGCDDCGDVMIHQCNRQEHESSSEFGQYIHDRGCRECGGDQYEKRWTEMYWLDVDGAIYKKKTKILRVIEHKNRGGSLRPSQREVLPYLAKAVQLIAATGLIHRQSGVFVVYSNHPHDTAKVEQIKGWTARHVMPTREIAGDELTDFLCGEITDPISKEAA